jgi:hypothetical protein
MKGPILVALLSPKTLHIVLQLGLHDPTYRHNVATDAGVNEIVLDLAVNRLWQLARIDVLHVILNLLDPYPLVERGLRSVFLRVENSAPTVNIDALVRRLPLSIHEMHHDFRLAFVALELDGLHEDLDGADSEDSPPQADKLVDQVRLDRGQGKDLGEVGEADLNTSELGCVNQSG